MELRPLTEDDFGEPSWEEWALEWETWRRGGESSGGIGCRSGHARSFHHGRGVLGWLDVTAVVSACVTLAFVVHWSV